MLLICIEVQFSMSSSLHKHKWIHTHIKQQKPPKTQKPQSLFTLPVALKCWALSEKTALESPGGEEARLSADSARLITAALNSTPLPRFGAGRTILRKRRN